MTSRRGVAATPRGMSPLPQLLEPPPGIVLRAVIAGTVRAGSSPVRPHYYAGAGNRFWELLHQAGLVPERLGPPDDERLPSLGIGLTDLVRVVDERAGHEPEEHWLVAEFDARVAASGTQVVAFVSRTAASRYAAASGLRAPAGYGPTSWPVAGRAGFVLPGPSGANNGMPMPVRIALWRDLADHLDELDRSGAS